EGALLRNFSGHPTTPILPVLASASRRFDSLQWHRPHPRFRGSNVISHSLHFGGNSSPGPESFHTRDHNELAVAPRALSLRLFHDRLWHTTFYVRRLHRHADHALDPASSFLGLFHRHRLYRRRPFHRH